MNRNDTLAMAGKHSIARDLACPDFFEGALLGNGSLGAVLCTRPDGIVLYFGHNNIWDIRIAEGHKDKIGTFADVWPRVLAWETDPCQGEWLRKYEEEVTASYFKPYPRPYPASALYLFFDRKEYEVLGHVLDISCGLVTVTLQNRLEERFFIQIFISQNADTAFCRTVNEQGEPAEVFQRMLLVPHTPDEGLPEYTVCDNGFIQLLPYNDYAGQVRSGVDKGFSVLYETDGKAERTGLKTSFSGMSRIIVQITEGYYDDIQNITAVRAGNFDEELEKTKKVWSDYWQCSGIALEDEFLERIWYLNTYFIRCVLNENCRCPGLFGNWMYQNIGTAWHGDYHMNYNTQQVFWGLMGANRTELHMPYLRLTEELLPVSRAWAKGFYQLEGACFPHSAYPVPMSVMPFPSPTWGWEIFETPWTVQSLWWHYTYTKDVELLRTRIYPVMREAAVFLVDYITRDGADPKKDGRYHLFPTIVPELYGLEKGLRKNIDGIADLTLTKFLFCAMLQAIEDLGIEKAETTLAEQIRDILAAYPEYPTAVSRRGEVFVSVESEDPDHVIYNVPTNLMPIFPGEDIDACRSSEQELAIAKRSWNYHYNEGGNDVVFYHLAGARLGIIDLEKFKRHIRYSMLPNGTVTDRVTLSGGRYADTSDFDFMARMGIWIENFSAYAVINECLIWGHTDVVELFPNWDMNKRAAFCSLRTKGAFLVDASCADGTVEMVKVISECGGTFQLKNPWKRAVDQNGTAYCEAVICINMKQNEAVMLTMGDETANLFG